MMRSSQTPGRSPERPHRFARLDKLSGNQMLETTGQAIDPEVFAENSTGSFPAQWCLTVETFVLKHVPHRSGSRSEPRVRSLRWKWADSGAGSKPSAGMIACPTSLLFATVESGMAELTARGVFILTSRTPEGADSDFSILTISPSDMSTFRRVLFRQPAVHPARTPPT